MKTIAKAPKKSSTHTPANTPVVTPTVMPEQLKVDKKLAAKKEPSVASKKKEAVASSLVSAKDSAKAPKASAAVAAKAASSDQAPKVKEPKVKAVKEPKVKEAKVKEAKTTTKKAAKALAEDGAGVSAKGGRGRKGVDKNYVAPPTTMVVKNTAKLIHTPSGLVGQVAFQVVIPEPIQKDTRLANNWKTKEPHELTDSEVIAMPEEEYMKKTQLAFFKLKLEQLRDSLLQNANETTEHMQGDTIVVPDPTDRATIEEEHALELRTRDRERKLLKKIEQSLVRIEKGEYGYCDETGEEIGVARLIARPTATLSLEAQQRREVKQKMFGEFN